MLDPTIATPRERVCVCAAKNQQKARENKAQVQNIYYTKN